ncbi:DUF3040 domain-containing protein [Actinoplanes sp. NPDC020271]|uniref:DUF3040 domain-containing protein n=1 Tax=Actinoplanes sp. NPDC020271 TaxID=3363896 RepID=UPI0037BB9784
MRIKSWQIGYSSYVRMGDGMLEEKDRRALADIEQQLHATDPGFARRMSAAPCPFPTVSALCVATFLAMPFLGLFLGPRAVLVELDVAATVVMIVLVSRAGAAR